MAATRSNDALLIRYEDELRNYDEGCLRINFDTSVEVATKRVFGVGHKFILSDLKELAYTFGLKWNVCALRSVKTISEIMHHVN